MTFHPPGPGLGGGAEHEYELLRGAARNHEIRLIAPNLPSDQSTIPVDGGEVPVKSVVWDPPPALQSPAEFAKGIALGWPTMEARAQRSLIGSLSAAIESELAGRPVDLIHLTFGEISPVIAACRAPTALLLFDVRARQFRRETEIAASRSTRVGFGLEARKMAAWERRWYSRADTIASVSSVDRDNLEDSLGGQVAVFPNPISDHFHAPASEDRSATTVTFVGTLGYWPNVDAVLWLTREIWPLVLKSCPEARLELVGYAPSPEVVDAAASSGATLHADVEDIRPFYWRAAVVVAPVRLGSGLRNKVLHAMACRAPVVATPTALEGIEARDGEHLWTGTTPGELADSIAEAIDNPHEAGRRAENALALIEDHRTERITERFESWWQAAAGRNGFQR